MNPSDNIKNLFTSVHGRASPKKIWTGWRSYSDKRSATSKNSPTKTLKKLCIPKT